MTHKFKWRRARHWAKVQSFCSREPALEINMSQDVQDPMRAEHHQKMRNELDKLGRDFSEHIIHDIIIWGAKWCQSNQWPIYVTDPVAVYASLLRSAGAMTISNAAHGPPVFQRQGPTCAGGHRGGLKTTLGINGKGVYFCDKIVTNRHTMESSWGSEALVTKSQWCQNLKTLALYEGLWSPWKSRSPWGFLGL